MKNKSSFIFALVIWLCCASAFSQEKPLLTHKDTDYFVYGQVQDMLTRQALDGVKSQILTADSVLLFEWTTNDVNGIYDMRRPFILLVPKAGSYVLRFSKDGYESKSISYKVDKLRRSELAMLHDAVLLKRAPRETTLKETTVRATKVKFYVRGDTLVYNADAFRLEEGSMLDVLIRQLPGAELKDDGRILVNGKSVESLLLNGEDFFRKDRSVMLENLPAYMVKDIRVYDKDGKTSELLGQSIGDQRLVMDVRLKKQYEIGWIGNAEVAGGSHERYLARLFALRFTGHSRLSAFAGLNNLNDRQRPGVNSEWMPSISSGLSTTRNAGVDYMVNDRQHRFKLTGDATASHTDTRSEERTSTHSYLQQGDTYGRSRYLGYAHSLNVSTNHDWTFNSKWANFLVRPSASYSRSRGERSNKSATADKAIFSVQTLDTIFSPDAAASQLAHILNRTEDDNRYNGHDLAGGTQVQASVRLPHTTDKLLAEGRLYYTESSYDRYAHRLYDYPQSGAIPDFRNEYGRNSMNNYSATAKLMYVSNVLRHNWTLMPSYEYSADRTRQRNRLNRLDYLMPEPAGWPALGVLPSVSNWMEQTFDPYHSLFTTQQNRYHVIAIKMSKREFRKNYWRFDFNLPLSIDSKSLDYNRPALADTSFTRNYVFFRPSLSAHNSWYRQAEDGRVLHHHELDLGYEMGMEPPSLSYFVNVRSDDNPLQVYTGNEHLHITHNYRWKAGYRWNNTAKQRILSANVNYGLVRDAVAMGYSYDRRTGVYTYRPENVDGNYSLSGQVGFSAPLDKPRRLTLDLNANSTCLHSMDLERDAVDGSSVKSSVNTTYLTPSVRLNYSVGHVRVGAKSSMTYTHQSSLRRNFYGTEAFDFNYGLNLVADIPMGWQVSTDATMYSRRGYADSGMNTDDFVWNMRISKKLMKDRLTLMLDGFDILNNLSNIRRNVNAQGYTETWYMSIPRYAMFHVVYRFNKAPKKK